MAQNVEGLEDEIAKIHANLPAPGAPGAPGAAPNAPPAPGGKGQVVYGMVPFLVNGNQPPQPLMQGMQAPMQGMQAPMQGMQMPHPYPWHPMMTAAAYGGMPGYPPMMMVPRAYLQGGMTQAAALQAMLAAQAAPASQYDMTKEAYKRYANVRLAALQRAVENAAGSPPSETSSDAGSVHPGEGMGKMRKQNEMETDTEMSSSASEMSDPILNCELDSALGDPDPRLADPPDSLLPLDDFKDLYDDNDVGELWNELGLEDDSHLPNAADNHDAMFY